MLPTTSVTSKSSGSAVVLEPGSRWPQEAFAANADCDRIVILHADPAATAASLVEHIVTQVSEFDRSGSKLHSIIIACAPCDRSGHLRRLKLIRTLIPLLTSGEGRLVMTSSQDSTLENEELLELARSMESELQERSIALVTNDRQVVAPVRATRKHSGIFSIDPNQLDVPVTSNWPIDAEFRGLSAQAT